MILGSDGRLVVRLKTLKGVLNRERIARKYASKRAKSFKVIKIDGRGQEQIVLKYDFNTGA